MSTVYLKVKICSLAAEATIIRQMEHRWRPRWRSHQDQTFFGLRSHRTCDVRREQRAALLAYGYLRGRAYQAIEFKCDEAPNWTRVGEIVLKFGPFAKKEDVAKAVVEWSKVASVEKAA